MLRTAIFWAQRPTLFEVELPVASRDQLGLAIPLGNVGQRGGERESCAVGRPRWRRAGRARGCALAGDLACARLKSPPPAARTPAGRSCRCETDTCDSEWLVRILPGLLGVVEVALGRVMAPELGGVDRFALAGQSAQELDERGGPLVADLAGHHRMPRSASPLSPAAHIGHRPARAPTPIRPIQARSVHRAKIV